MAEITTCATTSLPRGPTSFLGRDLERTFARTCLLEQSVPLLTLTGPGGVGKTRLALTTGEDLTGYFADGVVWVDLAPLTSQEAVTRTAAATLGPTHHLPRPILADLTSYLATRQLLLVVDNCEHVLAGTAGLVGLLIAACPALQVLATSRAAPGARRTALARRATPGSASPGQQRGPDAEFRRPPLRRTRPGGPARIQPPGRHWRGDGGPLPRARWAPSRD